VRRDIQAGFVGGNSELQLRFFAGDRDDRAGDDRAGAVRYDAGNSAGINLGTADGNDRQSRKPDE
jgi:hypothetical protein